MYCKNCRVWIEPTYFKEKQHCFPIGSNICTTHRKQSDKSVANAEDILDKSVNSENDPDFTPLEICLDKGEIEKSNRSITDIADILDASPVRFQLKRKKISDISTPIKSYLLRKFHEATTLLKEKNGEALAPGQTDEFIS